MEEDSLLHEGNQVASIRYPPTLLGRPAIELIAQLARESLGLAPREL